jgi:hypothetical protein
MANEEYFLTLCPDPLYLRLLWLDAGCEKAIEEIERGLRPSFHPESEILLLLSGMEWRSHLVGAVAAMLYEPMPAVAQALWNAFDAKSWVSPQLAVGAFCVDLQFSEQARTRIERGFPVPTAAQPRPGIWQRLSGAKSKPVRWESNADAKGTTALFYLCGLKQECQSWFGTLQQDPRVLRLVENDPDRGDEIARHWKSRLNELGLPRQYEGQ